MSLVDHGGSEKWVNSSQNSTPLLQLLEFCSDANENSVEIQQIIKSAAERLTALDVIIPSKSDVAVDAWLPAPPAPKKLRGIAAILVSEHLERKQAQALHDR